MKSAAMEKLADLQQLPATRGHGGPEEDCEDHDSSNPNGTPSMERFLKFSTVEQAQLYRHVVAFRCLHQRLYLRETAEILHYDALCRGISSTLEDTIRDLAIGQRDKLAEAECWVADPSKFDLPPALLFVYGLRSQAWDIATEMGYFEREMFSMSESDSYDLEVE